MVGAGVSRRRKARQQTLTGFDGKSQSMDSRTVSAFLLLVRSHAAAGLAQEAAALRETAVSRFAVPAAMFPQPGSP